MHALSGVHSNLMPRCACAVLVLLALAGVSFGQQLQFPRRLQFGLMRPPQSPQLTAAQVDLIPGTMAARLEQAKALIAAGEFDDVIEIYRELAAEDSDRVVAIGDHRFVSLRAYCHMQLARLPAAALSTYRRRVDATAERLYREGVANRDDTRLQQFIEEFFCSSWGDDALLALGEVALERGDYAAARRAWEQISPLLRDPSGRPVWLALHGIELNAHWPAIERRWNERSEPPDWLAFPDTQLNLADVRARLVLVSIRAGELDRAALELEVYRRFHPKARGQFAGQEGVYADTLQRLLESARSWPDHPTNADWSTFAGSPSRVPFTLPLHRNAATIWSKPIGLPSKGAGQARSELAPFFGSGGRHGLMTDAPNDVVGRTQRALSIYPVSVSGIVLYADAAQVRAMNLATGKPALTTDGVLYRGDRQDESQAFFDSRGPVPGAVGVPRFSMTVTEEIAYARVGRVATTQIQPDSGPTSERLIGLDLKREALLTFQVKPDDVKWSFDGAPLSDGRHVFVSMRRGEVTPRVYVACFDAATGRRLWRTSIGAANTLAGGQVNEITNNLLTLVSDRIYINTNFGLVAALHARDGRIAWIHRYDRAAPPRAMSASNGSGHFDRGPSPCMVADDMVFVAPDDTPSVFALDAQTGKPIWRSDKFKNAHHVIGVVEGRLIVTGDQFFSVDAKAGRVLFAWPDGERSGIRGMGRGLVAGREVFWPTRSEIYVLDALTGQQTRSPIPLETIGNRGANLIAAGDHLIAAGPDRLMAFGPRIAQPSPTKSTNTQPIAEYDRLTTNN